MKIVLIIILSILYSCDTIPDQDKTELTDTFDIISTREIVNELDNKINYTDLPYDSCLSNIDYQQKLFKEKYQSASIADKKTILDSVSVFLTEQITNKIMPYWYGTPWDFNGHTNIPNEGVVACGYLVSTTLKHFGFRINRYKFAQQSSMSEAKTLQPSSDLLIYRNKGKSNVIDKLKETAKDGLYIVGLDNHVGYLLKENSEIYFIHSNYIDNKVVEEIAIESNCFTSNIYVIGEISNNRKLLEKWIFGQEIQIHLD